MTSLIDTSLPYFYIEEWWDTYKVNYLSLPVREMRKYDKINNGRCFLLYTYSMCIQYMYNSKILKNISKFFCKFLEKEREDKL